MGRSTASETSALPMLLEASSLCGSFLWVPSSAGRGQNRSTHLPRKVASATPQLQRGDPDAAFSALAVGHPWSLSCPHPESGFLGTCSVWRHESKGQCWGRSGRGRHFSFCIISSRRERVGTRGPTGMGTPSLTDPSSRVLSQVLGFRPDAALRRAPALFP